MKPDKDLTVEDLREEIHQAFADGSMTEVYLGEALSRLVALARIGIDLRVQRAAFEKGARAQRRADVRFLKSMRDEMPDDRLFNEYDEDEKDEIQERAIHIGEAIIRINGHPSGMEATPLVKFEEEE